MAIDASFATRAIDPFRPPALMIALLTKARSDAGLTRAGLRARVGGRRTFVSKVELGERRLDAAGFDGVTCAIGVDLYEVVREAEGRG